MNTERFLPDEAATLQAGARLAVVIRSARPQGSTLYLTGDLGAGKTTLVRGLLHELGHRGAVPSPTYTLVEPYALEGLIVNHVDLYRLGSALEADELALHELTGPDRLLLIEWPERGSGRVPPADLLLALSVEATGRRLRCEARGTAGEGLLRGV